VILRLFTLVCGLVSSELRDSELAVRRYDTNYLQEALIRLVPELAKSGSSADPAKVVSIHRSN
jgi:hypothetical protein